MIQKSQYNKAESLFANKDYYEAIQIYGQLGEYKDSSEKILEAKYQYIMKYPDAENTYIYLSELMNMDYKNSHSLYDSYYELKVNICANNSDKYDGDLHKTNFKLYNPIYFHIFLSGGDPNKDYEEYNLNYKISGPGGNSYSRKLYGYDEEIITWYYTIESGPVTIRVYCDDKLLAESTVYYVDED